MNLLSRHSDAEYNVTAVEVHSYRNSHCDHFTAFVRSWVEIGHDTTDKYSKAFIDIRLHAGVTTPVAPYGPLWPNVTSSIKPQVHNVSQCHQRRTEPQPQGICRKNFATIGPAFQRYACRQTDKQTDRRVTIVHTPTRAEQQNNRHEKTVQFDAAHYRKRSCKAV